jgi:hypothetical protein
MSEATQAATSAGFSRALSRANCPFCSLRSFCIGIQQIGESIGGNYHCQPAALTQLRLASKGL